MSLANNEFITPLEITGDEQRMQSCGFGPNDMDELLKLEGFIEVTQTGDDAGVNFTGQVSVGTPSTGKELVVGEGDSYPVRGAWHCSYSNISGLTVTSATDVTSILQSDSGSLTGLFNGTTSGQCLLVYSDLARFGGAKVKLGTAGVVEPDNVVAEYLQDNSPTWVETKFMASDGDYPYESKSNVLGSCASCSEQWRFSFDPNNVPPVWNVVTMNINGSNYTGRFALIRLTGSITSDPTVEQIKLHTNRWECNATGATEYFGLGRYKRTLNTHEYENADKATGDQNLSLASGITLSRSDNVFANSANDGFILQGVVPVGLDTSIPLELTVEWYADASGSGDIEIEAELVKVTNGFTWDGTATSSALLPVVTSVSSEQYVRKQSKFQFFLEDLLPGDQYYLSVFRDATSGNADDTFVGSVIITYNEVDGYFWKP